jgi:hypothetical protein
MAVVGCRCRCRCRDCGAAGNPVGTVPVIQLARSWHGVPEASGTNEVYRGGLLEQRQRYHAFLPGTAQTSDAIKGLLIRRLHVRVVPGVQRVRPLIHGGRSSVWLEHLVVVQEVAGSNPVGHPNTALLPIGEEGGSDDLEE